MRSFVIFFAFVICYVGLVCSQRNRNNGNNGNNGNFGAGNYVQPTNAGAVTGFGAPSTFETGVGQQSFNSFSGGMPPQISNQLQQLQNSLQRFGRANTRGIVSDLRFLTNTVRGYARNFPRQYRNEFQSLQSQVQRLRVNSNEQRVRQLAQQMLGFISRAYSRGVRPGAGVQPFTSY